MSEASVELLKTVRKARKIGRPRLAKLTGLTERQIARFETGTGVPSGALAKLSAALQVPESVLTGEEPLADEDLMPAAEGCTKGCCG